MVLTNMAPTYCHKLISSWWFGHTYVTGYKWQDQRWGHYGSWNFILLIIILVYGENYILHLKL